MADTKAPLHERQPEKLNDFEDMQICILIGERWKKNSTFSTSPNWRSQSAAQSTRTGCFSRNGTLIVLNRAAALVSARASSSFFSR